VVEILPGRHQPGEDHRQRADRDQHAAAQHRVSSKALRPGRLLQLRMLVVRYLRQFGQAALDRELPEPGNGEGTYSDQRQVMPAPLDLATDGVYPHDHQRQGEEHEPQGDAQRTFNVRHGVTPSA